MRYILFFLFVTITLFASRCHKPAKDGCKSQKIETRGPAYTGRVVKAGACGQRVIEVIDATKFAGSLETQWTDTTSGVVYRNVFSISNKCDFPAFLTEGKSFFFRLGGPIKNDCVWCEAYVTVPAASNPILLEE